MIIPLKKVTVLFYSVMTLGFMGFINNYASANQRPGPTRHIPFHYQPHFSGPGIYYESRGPSAGIWCKPDGS